MTILYIALVIVGFIIILRLKGKFCGPKCKAPKTSQSKKKRGYLEEKEEIRKRIERQKGQKVEDLDLFSDFIKKGEKK